MQAWGHIESPAAHDGSWNWVSGHNNTPPVGHVHGSQLWLQEDRVRDSKAKERKKQRSVSHSGAQFLIPSRSLILLPWQNHVRQ